MRASVFIATSLDGYIARLDGALSVQGFLRAGLIQRLILTRIPVLLGSGIPLFGHLPGDLRLEHVATRSFPSGLVQSEYQIPKRPSQSALGLA
jgi:dihydrofolate reductase